MNHRNRIDRLLDDGCLLEVEEWTTELIENGLEDWWACFNRGIARFRMRLYQEAHDDFAFVAQFHPGNASVATNLGVCKYKLHDYEGAEVQFLNAIVFDPEYDHARVSLGNLYYRFMKRYEEAIEIFNQAIELNPESEAWASRGDLYLDLNRLEEAEADAIESLRLFPEDAHSVLFFGEVQSAFGHRSLFYEYLEKAIEMDPDVLEDVNPSVIQRHILEKRFQDLVMRHLEGRI